MFELDESMDEVSKVKDINTSREKIDFVPPSQGAPRSPIKIKQKGPVSIEEQEDLASKVNSAFQSSSKSDTEMLIEDVQLTEFEQSVVEQILFEGYAEYDIDLGWKGRKVTAVTVTPADFELGEHMIRKYLESKKDESGEYQVSESLLSSRRNIYNFALSIVGLDGKDLSDVRGYQLKVLKAAFKKAETFLDDGEIEKYDNIMKSIEAGVNFRSRYIRQEWSTILTDLITLKKGEFEDRVYNALRREGAIPKS